MRRIDELVGRIRSVLFGEDVADVPVKRVRGNGGATKGSGKYGAYITKDGSGFRVQKTLDGRIRRFGTYRSHEEAVRVRDALMAVDWDENKIKKE